MSVPTIDHVNVKIMARQPYPTDLGKVIPVFHRWIQEDLVGGLPIDVADYRHVPSGPGVMLIGHESNYSLDLEFGRLGLLYNRKLPAQGSFEEKLRDAYGAALAACALLEEEPALSGELSFDAAQCEVIINDRLLAPNTEETWRALRPDLERFFGNLFGADRYELAHAGEPRERFRALVRTEFFVPVSKLMEQGAASSISP